MTVAPPEGRGIDRLLAIMAQLRSPIGGCPWDLDQNFATIAPYTIEEAYEVVDAIAEENWPALAGELGDLLLQVVYHSQLGAEKGLFDFDSVASLNADKMVRRHPHVFKIDGAESTPAIATAADQNAAWETLKAAERAKSASQDSSVLAGVAIALPALTRAIKIQNRAARVGFDWSEPAPILAKIEEEMAELRYEIESAASPERIEEELGDLLFSVANLARRLAFDAEAVLKRATLKFERRFRRMETLAQPGSLAGRDPAALEVLWQQVKDEEAVAKS